MIFVFAFCVVVVANVCDDLQCALNRYDPSRGISCDQSACQTSQTCRFTARNFASCNTYPGCCSRVTIPAGYIVGQESTANPFVFFSANGTYFSLVDQSTTTAPSPFNTAIRGGSYGRNSTMLFVSYNSSKGVIFANFSGASCFTASSTRFRPSALLWSPLEDDRSRILVACASSMNLGRILRLTQNGGGDCEVENDVVPDSPLLADVRAFALSPDQRSLFVLSRGSDNQHDNVQQWMILIFDVDVPVTASASLRSRIVVSDASQLNGIVFHPRNHSIFYVTDSLTSQCIGLIDAFDTRCFERLLVFHVDGRLLRTLDTMNSFQLWLNSGLANASDQRKFSYFSRSNYSVSEATDYRRLDGVSAMTWSEDGRYLLVTAGMSAVFPPGIAVAPHIFKIAVDPSNATNFLNIVEFTRSYITAQSMGIYGKCSANCTVCRNNPSTFQAECHDCRISNGGCDDDIQCISDRDGRICRCPSGKTLLYGKRCADSLLVATMTHQTIATTETLTTLHQTTTIERTTKISSLQHSLDVKTKIPINTTYQRSTSDTTFVMMIAILVLCTLLGIAVMLVYFQCRWILKTRRRASEATISADGTGLVSLDEEYVGCTSQTVSYAHSKSVHKPSLLATQC